MPDEEGVDADGDADADANLFDYVDAGAPDGPDESTDREGALEPSRGASAPENPAPIDSLTGEERVELGVDLLAHLELAEASLAEVVDRVETVTTNPALTREILDAAEARGVIERDGARIRTRTGGTFVRFESQVVRRRGEFDCRRCGASLSTGHFVRFESGELGPFGSSCVRKVTGRE
jgi:hypothetical protein